MTIAIAQHAAHSGAAVQVVGIMPDGPTGDAGLITLAAAGVGHAAVLRSGPRQLEPADLELALRYLPDTRVVVAVGLAADAMAAAGAGAAFAGATLIVVTTSATGASDPDGLPQSAVVLRAPAADPDGAFAGFVATFATRLDAGEQASPAWDATVRTLAIDPVTRGPVDRTPTDPPRQQVR